MTKKIVRTPSRAEGGITDAERAAMAEHVKLWTARAFRTEPIDPEKIVPAIEGLYAAAKLKKPRVVIAPSPLVMALTYGAASTILARHATAYTTHDATYAATRDATRDATAAATDYATYAATYAATAAATDYATYAATDDATRRATDAATYAATDDATSAATYAATYEATAAATRRATAAATRRATDDATDAATYDATYAATHAATAAATDYATYAATDDATRRATDAATDYATDYATYAATADATDYATAAATYAATRRATSAAAKGAAQACLELAGIEGLQAASHWSLVYQGGNMWAAFDSYVTAARDILGLRLPEHEAYACWEQAAIHGGFRVMHEDFCIVSDFPEHIRVDENNRPHCENGPSHRWRDGWELYHWHGIQVPGHWIMDPDNVDPVEILRENNVEKRAAGCAILGWARMSEHLERRIIDGDPDSDVGALVELTLPDLPEPGRFLMAKCPRNGTICEGVPRVSDIDGKPIETAIAAQAWRDCLPQAEYTHPAIRT